MILDDAMQSWQRGDYRLTRQLCGRQLAQTPTDVAALNLFAMACASLGDVEQAIQSLQAAIAVAPEDPALRNNLGNALLAAQRWDAAIDCFRAVTSSVPHYADGHFNLGNALQKAGRPQHAVGAYRRAVECNPTHARAYYQLGNALRQNRELNAAAAAYESAAQLIPDFADALQNQAGCLIETGQYGAALAVIDRLLRLRPVMADTHYALGAAKQGLGLLPEAAAAYAAALNVKPQDARYVAALWQCQRWMCQWNEELHTRRALLAALASGQSTSFEWIPALAADSAHALQLAERAGQAARGAAAPLAPTAAYAHEKIRVAYLTAGLAGESARRLLWPILKHHDRSAFEISVVLLALPKRFAEVEDLKSNVDHWIEVHEQADADIARFIRDAEIDIVIDLEGRGTTRLENILGMRPAPVQLQYLGVGGSMGVPHIDYLIADEFLVPVAETQYYREQLVYLPFAHCFVPASAAANVAAARDRFGLPSTSFLFCCLNSCVTISAEIFEVWMRLLLRVPESRLCLMAENPWALRQLSEEAARRGVSADRLIFSQPMTLKDRLAYLTAMDLYLDTPIQNDWLRVADALDAGLPAITHAGGTFWARRSGSLLRAAGLPQLVAASLQEYESRAAALALKPDTRRGLRDSLRAASARGVESVAAFTAQLERAYRSISNR